MYLYMMSRDGEIYRKKSIETGEVARYKCAHQPISKTKKKKDF